MAYQKIGYTKKRSEVQKLEDLVITMELYLKGVTYEKIAIEVCKSRDYTLTAPTISKDISACLASWYKKNQDVLDRNLTIQLGKLDLLERTYWENWQKSTTAKTKNIVKKSGAVANSPTYASIEDHTEQVVGDSKWLDGVQWCITERNRLLGLYLIDKKIAADADAQTDASKVTSWEVVLNIGRNPDRNRGIEEAKEV